MRKWLWKIMPFVVGIGFGIFMFNPPDLLKSMGCTGLVILPAIFAALIFFFVPGYIFARIMFQDVVLIPVERDLRRKDIRLLAEKFWKLGFKPVPKALKIPNPPGIIYGFVREDIAVSGAIIRVEAGFGKTTFAFASSLGNDTKGLTTVKDISGALGPRAPGSFLQALPGRDMEELLLEHLQSVEWLNSRGLATCAVSGEKFEENELKGAQRQREYLRKEWFKNTAIFVWRLVSRTTPYRGAIKAQKDVVEYVRQVAGEPKITKESQLRLKMIEQLQQWLAEPASITHSGNGIASFVLALSAGMAEFAAIIFIMITTLAGGARGRMAGVAGLVIILGAIGYLAGLVFGIAGAMERHRKKIFAVLGIVLNALGLILLCGLIGLGMLAGSRFA